MGKSGGVTLTVTFPPPNTPGFKHNVAANSPSANFGGFCEGNSAVMDVDPLTGGSPLTTWTITPGSGNNIHIADGGNPNTSPTPNFNADLSPQ